MVTLAFIVRSNVGITLSARDKRKLSTSFALFNKGFLSSSIDSRSVKLINLYIGDVI